MKEIIYTTLQNEKLNLLKINKKQKELLRRLYGLYKSVIFGVLQDLANRLAIKHRLLKKTGLRTRRNIDFTENAKALEKFLDGA